MGIRGPLLFALSIILTDSRIIREKRQLIFTPKVSIVQLILGTGIPVPLDSNQALTIGYVLKAAYALPNNATVFTNPYINYQKRSVDGSQATRFEIYGTLANFFASVGGKACILRAICEAAQVPLKRSGLIGHILHIIFTPSTTDEVPTNSEDSDYIHSAHLGSGENLNCEFLFPKCSHSFLDMLTALY